MGISIIQPITAVPITNPQTELAKSLLQVTRQVDGKLSLAVSHRQLPHNGGRSSFYKSAIFRYGLDGNSLNHQDRLQLKGIRRTLPQTNDIFLKGAIDLIKNMTMVLSNIDKIDVCNINTTYVEDKKEIDIVSAKLDYRSDVCVRSIAMYLGFHLDPLDLYGFFLGALSKRDRTLYQMPHDIGLGVRASLEIYLDPTITFITNECGFIELHKRMLEFKGDKICLKNKWAEDDKIRLENKWA